MRYKLIFSIIVSLFFANYICAQIAIDTYNNGERRIQTEGCEYEGVKFLLDTYANELTKDTTYYLKVGVKDIPDSIVVTNKLLIKLPSIKERDFDELGNFIGYKHVGSDTTLILTCCQVTKKNTYPVLRTQTSANAFNGSFVSIANAKTTTESYNINYMVAFYAIKKEDLIAIINRGTKALRIETVNKVSDSKAKELAKVIKKLYTNTERQLAKPCLKQQIDNF